MRAVGTPIRRNGAPKEAGWHCSAKPELGSRSEAMGGLDGTRNVHISTGEADSA
jgi:hypothetical protein